MKDWFARWLIFLIETKKYVNGLINRATIQDVQEFNLGKMTSQEPIF